MSAGSRWGLRTVPPSPRRFPRWRGSPPIAAAAVEGYLIEEMAPAGREIVVGAIRDPQFGPMVMVGLGGIFVEVLGDVSFRLCPIDRAEAASMLDELKGAAAARRHAGVDRGLARRRCRRLAEDWGRGRADAA